MRAAYLLYFSEAAPENKHLIQIPDKICYLWLLVMWIVHLK